MKDKNLVVVLVHGFRSDGASFHYLKRALNKAGYDAREIEVSLTFNTLESCVAELQHQCQIILRKNPNVNLCFIGHSTGGLVIRALLGGDTSIAQRTGSCLIVCVPNRGTPLADLHENIFSDKVKVWKPLRSLTRRANAVNNWEWPAHVKMLGVGGSKSAMLTNSLFVGVNHGVVAAASIDLESMEDLIILPCSHTEIMQSEYMVNTTLSFLKFKELPAQLLRMNIMTLEEKFKYINEKPALDQLFMYAQANIESGTLGGVMMWHTLADCNGWKLQRNRITSHIRVLNPSKIRKLWGSKNRVSDTFDLVISKIKADAFSNSLKSKSI